MSRFGSTATFYYAQGDLFANGGTYLYLNPAQMPQYPFQTDVVTDKVTYRAKSGRKWIFQNYNLRKFTFNWTMLDESARNALKTMYDSEPILTFNSNGSTWGTFRMGADTWTDSESAFELYDLTMTIEEDV